MKWEILTPVQQAVARLVLKEEGRRRRHLVVALSGAHAYGFPSPDSDLDLKGIHIEPTKNLLSLESSPLHGSRLEVIEGVEVDYSSNELQPVLLGILAGNGNYIERVLGALIVETSSEHDGLRPLVQRSLSRRVYRHYHGFAASQLRGVEEAQAASAKKVLYVLRTALTGAHLLRAGELVVDVTQLLGEYGFADAQELIDIKRAGERTALSDLLRNSWTERLKKAFLVLDDAYAASHLPEDASNGPEIEAWLLEQRQRLWS